MLNRRAPCPACPSAATEPISVGPPTRTHDSCGCLFEEQRMELRCRTCGHVWLALRTYREPDTSAGVAFSWSYLDSNRNFLEFDDGGFEEF